MEAHMEIYRDTRSSLIVNTVRLSTFSHMQFEKAIAQANFTSTQIDTTALVSRLKHLLQSPLTI